MSRASIRWISGPVLRAVAEGPFALREAVRVGPRALLGEVVRLDGDEIVVQVYEDTTGMRPGIEVEGTGLPLAIPLGPGLLGNIFDGLLRPLSGTDSDFVQPGMRHAKAATFAYVSRVKPGDVLPPGSIIGDATGPSGRVQAVVAPPGVGGEVVAVAAPGDHPDDATVCTVRVAGGGTRELSMCHDWPVRDPAPGPAPAAGDRAAGHRPADHRLPVSGGARRQGGRAGRVRHRQDGAARSAGQGLQRRRHRLSRLRRARQRNGGRARRIPAARRSADRAAADGTHGDHRQHVEHAGRGARGVDLFRDHRRRIFPRPGLARGADGRLDQPLGRGAARSLRPLRRASRRRRLSRVPVEPPRRLLRARGHRRAARGRHRLGHGDRRDQPAVGRLLRAGDEPHQALREGVLGARREAGAGAVLSGDPSIAVVRGGRRHVRAVVDRAGQQPVAHRCGGGSSRCSTRKRTSSGWRGSSARTRCRCASS